MLINGKWQENWHPFQSNDNHGRFIRETSSIRHWVTRDGQVGPSGDAGFPAEVGRYHLFVAYICPWASRTLVVRGLKKLEEIISISVVEPELSNYGWQFSEQDVLTRADYLHQVYTQSVADYTGRATVPVLWDKKTGKIVNNESADIVNMLNTAFDHLIEAETPDLRPFDHDPQKKTEFDELNRWIYEKVNNGVYQAGFARSQQAYQEAYYSLFEALDQLDQRLAGQDFLWGNLLTESDIRLFVTLIRFDLAYHGLFKTNKKMLSDFHHFKAYVQRMLRQPGIAATVNPQHIKRGYYSIKALNPSGIVPEGPWLDYLEISS